MCCAKSNDVTPVFSKPAPLGLVSHECAIAGIAGPISVLTRQMCAGSDDGWLEFHNRYYLSLLRYAASCLNSPQDAADVVQHAYLRIGRHLKEFDDEESFWRWLACVVRCAAIDYRRGIRRRLTLLEKFAHWQEAQNSSAGPAAELTQTSALGIEALAKLSCEDASLLRLKYYEGWTVDEIALHMGVTSKAIENRLARLRQRLRDIITRIQ
jgi:RNA polymerase sigma-70 factor (ECF subfamily)